MKKFLLLFATVAMMVSCNGNANQGSGSAASGEAEQAPSFSVQNGISGTTGTKNCFIPELGAPITFEVAGEGDILDVTATVKLKHKDKTEIEEMTKPAELWISGRDEDNKDVKLTLIADEESQAKVVEWLKAATGEEVEVVFKAKLPKADMDKLNAKECTNTLVL
jgi:hypothetical protein